MLFVLDTGNTYGFFLLTEHRHGYRGHEEQALRLSVEQLKYRGTKHIFFLARSISFVRKKR